MRAYQVVVVPRWSGRRREMSVWRARVRGGVKGGVTVGVRVGCKYVGR